MFELTPTWQSDCGCVAIWNHDCGEVMATWPDRVADVLLTDPPYGIGKQVRQNVAPSQKCAISKHRTKEWDCRTEDERVACAIQKSRQAIVFGGNYYSLPPSSCWLVWDKVPQGFSMADAELAWTNLRQAVRIKRFQWQGMLRDGRDAIKHPTQKPVEVMAWCLGFTSGETVCDPFMGSGTTGVAAVRHGWRFWGIEKDPEYFEIAKRRIQDELRRSYFLEPVASLKPTRAKSLF